MGLEALQILTSLPEFSAATAAHLSMAQLPLAPFATTGKCPGKALGIHVAMAD